MRMRKKKNLIPRMQACADRLIEDPYDMPEFWRNILDGDLLEKAIAQAREAGKNIPDDLSQYQEPLELDWSRPLYLEVGCGKGRFTAGLAKANPDALVVGLEIVPEAIVVAMERCADLPNAFFIRAGADQLPQFFAPGEVDRIYLNFSDPWPSNRHAKRRLTHGNFLKLYREILHPGGEIHFKTDNQGLFDFSVEELPRYGFTLSEVTRDLHKDGPVGIMTDYEAKFHAQGIPICRLVGTMEADWQEPYPSTPKEARKRWLSAFASAVPAEILRQHVTAEGNYLWHIFTWGKVPCLEGDAAREALCREAEAGADAYLFYWEYPPAGIPAVAHIGKPVPENLPDGENYPVTEGSNGADWYLTDRAFTWTYVGTHEEGAGLGPYFCRVKET